MSISKKRLARFSALLSDPAWVEKVLEQSQTRRTDPFSFSSLAYWLSLESWTKDEGLLLLAGIDPPTVEEAPFGLEKWNFVNALPLNKPEHFLLDPTEIHSREEWPYDEDSYESFIEAFEEKSVVLNSYKNILETLHHRLDRSIEGLGESIDFSQSKFKPNQFLAWAGSFGFTPVWLAWAREHGLLPDVESAMVAPFFDADSDEYPELLHIAVRAWEHARSVSGGTPKQRVLEYLQSRYPKIGESSKEAIAVVTNWQKTGGRPKKGG